MPVTHGVTGSSPVRTAFGSLAQLNRASDYGSEGYRFESYRSHSNKEETCNKHFSSFSVSLETTNVIMVERSHMFATLQREKDWLRKNKSSSISQSRQKCF